MKTPAALVLCVILFALVGLLSLNVEPSLALVDPTIWQALESQGQADILVVLREQADLSAALGLTTKEEKGWCVYQKLTEVAERTQAPLRAFLDQRRAVYRPYWIHNLIRVQADTDRHWPAGLRSPGSTSFILTNWNQSVSANPQL
jgi:hypothetical protein